MNLDVELVVRILVGTALGGIIGYERDIHGRPAGLRTHALVALASATFMVVSTHLAYYQRYGPHDFTEVDGSRIAASVVSGIGFLAGGAILRTGFSIQGLTTAAGLWLVAAIGLCAGGGMYYESIAATVLGVVALTLLRRFEDKDDRIRRRLVLTLTEAALPTDSLVEKLAALDLVADDRRLEPRQRAPPADARPAVAPRQGRGGAGPRRSRPSRASRRCSSIPPS